MKLADPSILVLPAAEAIAVGVLAGLVGAFVVLSRRVFFAESLSHGIFPGAVLGVVGATACGIHAASGLMVGAALGCIPLIALTRFLGGVRGVSSSAAAGVTLTVGYALGIVLLRWFQPLPIRVDTFLVGSLTTVDSRDVTVAVALLIACLVILVPLRRQIIATAFDRDSVRASGGPTQLCEYLVLGAATATMVALVPAVGTILSLALLVAPAAGLRCWVSNPSHLLVGSTLVGVVLATGGLAAAVILDLSAGGTIAALAGVFYVGSTVCRALR